jgi:hypothetical protein
MIFGSSFWLIASAPQRPSIATLPIPSLEGKHHADCAAKHESKLALGVIAVLHAAYDDQRADAEGASTRRYRNENVFRSFTARASPRKFHILQ